MFARRPPIGAGSLFLADDEAGEMFSNSYLSDLKSGLSTSDHEMNRGRLSSIGSVGSADSGRVAELARRNTMVPLHLKSSYPVTLEYILIRKRYQEHWQPFQARFGLAMLLRLIEITLWQRGG